jgi:hypothetical protein
MPHAQIGEAPYIQHRHFGAAIAPYCLAILGNRLKTAKNAPPVFQLEPWVLKQPDDDPAVFLPTIDPQRAFDCMGRPTLRRAPIVQNRPDSVRNPPVTHAVPVLLQKTGGL